MSSSAVAETAPLPLPILAPSVYATDDVRRRITSWRNWIGPAISLAMLAAAFVQLRSLDLHEALALLPTAPAFWLALAGAYMALPLSEWLIYRRLWRLPVTGLLPLLRKRISNEILLGYSGEVFFYAWARRRVGMAGAPFGVIKDVALLSAQVGNLVTLALVALAWPLIGAVHLGTHGRDLILSCTLVVLISLPAILFRGKLLSLPAGELRRVGLIHLARVTAGLVLSAVMWHEVLPHIALSWWIVMAALRQLLSRLPLIPNKDIAFAGLTAFLIGPRSDLVAMVAMTASLILVIHLVLGVVLALADLLTPAAPR